MLVSLRWLARYVDLPADPDELANRLSLSGLNHEETVTLDGDTIFDLEVTSNRGDCLGHVGVAREISVLYGSPLKRPDPHPSTGPTPVDSLLTVENRFPEACPRYTARVIQGVTVGPSPDWMVEALRSVYWKRKLDGTIETYKPINNVVDATNYVLMECGQPLHAFDHAKIAERTLVVRPGEDKEVIEAIDHKSYSLDPSTCVIADARAPQAIAGVMGGAHSEVTSSTGDVVIESAVFTPLNVRRAARRLKLHSPSSFRFERKVDPVGVDWASRRVCQLILETAGGTLAEGVIDTAPEISPASPIPLKLSDIERLLGIAIDRDTVIRILTDLGCQSDGDGPSSVVITPPSWRHDLTRGADLIEEVARIHGYDKIPEDAPIPVTPSTRRVDDDLTDKVRTVMVSAGFAEAMTPSVVTAKLDQCLSPWTERPALQTQTAMLKGAKTIRRSLIPSLLESRALNWSAASRTADLFEIAHVYLPGAEVDGLPEERYSLGMVSGHDFFELKGVIEALCERLGVVQTPGVEVDQVVGFENGTGAKIMLGDVHLGWIGRVDAKLQKQFKLPTTVVAAELSVPVMIEAANLVPQQQRVSGFPSIKRDLNFICDEAVRWADLETVARESMGATLAHIEYRETYRDEARDGKGRKRLLLTVELQKFDATLSGDEADDLVGRLIDSASKKLSAKLLD